MAGYKLVEIVLWVGPDTEYQPTGLEVTDRPQSLLGYGKRRAVRKACLELEPDI